MTPSERNSEAASAGAREFRTTHWSVVLLARHDSTVRAEPAPAELCRVYWYPLYAFRLAAQSLGRRGRSEGSDFQMVVGPMKQEHLPRIDRK